MISQGISANLTYSTGERSIFTNIHITVLVKKKVHQIISNVWPVQVPPLAKRYYTPSPPPLRPHPFSHPLLDFSAITPNSNAYSSLSKTVKKFDFRCVALELIADIQSTPPLKPRLRPIKWKIYFICI